MVAEVMVKNDDVGFVYPQQKVKIKLAAYPFQQYGMIDGEILTVGADANDDQQASQRQGQDNNRDKAPPSIYKAIVALDSQQLTVDKSQFKLVPGMQVTAEINQGKRTVLEYILSPLEKTVRESAHER